ncbi:MAG: DNA translocase FtsK 4TM domain-containing protein [Nitrospirales bacterium]|nr:DNA translocase FtsK 4TM domain-containing protein [Nitrospira sp.]MDR4501250.1 DNA translocase FtsK 4TM domain-containing protein [Nitrospirales bacterium]
MSIFPSTARSGKKGRKSENSPLTSQVIGICLITFGVLLFLSVVSFHPHDPVLFDQPDIFSSSTEPGGLHNWVGKVGSTLGFGLLSGIGAAAYFAPLLVVIFGTYVWARESMELKIQHAVGALLAILSLSAISQFQFFAIPTIHEQDVGSGMAGGYSGYWLAWILEQNFASLGSHILLAASFIVSLVLLSPSLIPGTARRLFQWSGAAKEVVQSQIARHVEARQYKSIKPNKPVKINRSMPLRGGIGGLLGFRGSDKSSADGSEQSSEVITIEAHKEDEPESPAAASSESPPVYGSVSKTYRPPSPSRLLVDAPARSSRQTDQVLESQSQVLTKTLEDFGIEGKVTEVHPGPVITMYEFAPGPGIKVSRIVNLADDLAMALKALKVRVVAPLPGKSTVGIEVPNPIRETVSLKDMLTSSVFLRSQAKLALALGKDIYGHPVVSDLRTMPHLLVAGATGAGKSVGLNCMLLNILFTAHPDEVKLLLIDPKVLELQVYDGIPHLIRPVITDPKSAARGLTWVVHEMERRYRLLAEHGVRSIDAFNRKASEEQRQARSFKPSKKTAKDAESTIEGSNTEDAPTPLTPLPYIVVVIDEFADLMMVAPKEVEDRIARLAQMARASGIHLILATQRPSVDVVTGLIKANFPVRIAYQVSSKIDSRTILDTNGAETLLGKGDMLYMASGSGRVTRLHGPFVSDDEVREVVEWVKQQAAPVYEDEEFFSTQETSQEEDARDETYERARELVMETGQASASFIQRRLRVGYPRAARMIEQMESEGLVSAPGRDGRREVLTRQALMGETG